MDITFCNLRLNLHANTNVYLTQRPACYVCRDSLLVAEQVAALNRLTCSVNMTLGKDTGPQAASTAELVSPPLQTAPGLFIVLLLCPVVRVGPL